MSEFSGALKAANIKIIKYDPTKKRPVMTNRGTVSLEGFCKLFQKDLGKRAIEFPEVFGALHDMLDVEKLLENYAEEHGLIEKARQVPEPLKGLKLNCNMAAKGREERFFLSTPSEAVSPIAGEFFLLAHNLQPADAVAQARHVVPEYLPRKGPGVFRRDDMEGEFDIFNMYTPAPWTQFEGELEDELPEIFVKLVNHLFPIEEEREFFFAWLHDSLFKRAYTFLILCGAPGTGKNRLKLVMRALHGHVNTIDGKKSTLTERFNSQLGESTLAWFDELHYDMDMENTMKELQNDSISIERKGVDATRATKIHSSIVISNNKPRDNYIAFDARKFVPLTILGKRLETSMSAKEIDMLTQKVEDQTKPTYDIEFIAQIARWIESHGASKKWPNQEYRGPMFWKLAHTSMSRWQKKAAILILETTARPNRAESDPKKGLLWSSLADKSMKKHGDKSLHFPDHTTVKVFFDVFRDGKGRKAFETRAVADSIMGDFWVKPLFKKMAIITEASIVEQREKENEKNRKEVHDL